MKVAVFTRSTALGEIEDDINEWLEEKRLSPADILRVEQSQSSSDEADILIISVWYIPKTGDWLTENLPPTTGPRTLRLGEEYGAEV